MDLRHMRHFVAVAEELHFGRAARRLNMAQPPVSQSIRRLEDDLGVVLFNRSRRGVELTEAGQIFLVEARRTLMQAELAGKMARRAVSGSTEVRVSFVGAALNNFLPSLIVSFHEAHPDTRLTLEEMISRNQVDRLLAGDLDIAFVLGHGEYSGSFERLVVERSLFVAAVPAHWDIARQESVTLAELARQPFIRPPEKSMRGIPETLAIFHSVGHVPNVVQEVTQTGVMLGLIGAGLGCSVITATCAMRPPPDVRFLPIADHPPHRRWELAMIWNPDHLNPSSAAFVQVTKDYVAARPQLLDLA
ncbi:LysR substrate-binding domain-containing protein [Novosphingobium bradum]|uniref:LysR substrate-binding domain-containing protein n=1 Tax=Novosphingobium bradum TaxID=1737444 RepID=A0ABV7INW7_9SPHN